MYISPLRRRQMMMQNIGGISNNILASRMGGSFGGYPGNYPGIANPVRSPGYGISNPRYGGDSGAGVNPGNYGDIPSGIDLGGFLDVVSHPASLMAISAFNPGIAAVLGTAGKMSKAKDNTEALGALAKSIAGLPGLAFGAVSDFFGGDTVGVDTTDDARASRSFGRTGDRAPGRGRGRPGRGHPNSGPPGTGRLSDSNIGHHYGGFQGTGIGESGKGRGGAPDGGSAGANRGGGPSGRGTGRGGGGPGRGGGGPGGPGGPGSGTSGRI